jgi:hypothetical protein
LDGGARAAGVKPAGVGAKGGNAGGNTYADASLFSLRSAVEKLPWNGLEDDAQRDAQRNDFAGHSASLAVTVEDRIESGKSPVEMGLKSLSVAVCPGMAKTGEWLQRQGSNLQPAG